TAGRLAPRRRGERRRIYPTANALQPWHDPAWKSHSVSPCSGMGLRTVEEMSPTNRLSETSTPVPASLQLRRIASLCCALLAGYFSLATSAAPVCYYEQKLAGH